MATKWSTNWCRGTFFGRFFWEIFYGVFVNFSTRGVQKHHTNFLGEVHDKNFLWLLAEKVQGASKKKNKKQGTKKQSQ
jgi:hypothetical protein